MFKRKPKLHATYRFVNNDPNVIEVTCGGTSYTCSPGPGRSASAHSIKAELRDCIRIERLRLEGVRG